MSTLQLPATDEAVFTEDEDEEYDERQHYEYQERNTEDYPSGDTEEYRNGDTEEYQGTYEEDDRERQKTEDDEERPKEYERLRTDYDPDQANGGYEIPPKVGGNISTGEKDVISAESQESQERLEVYKTICENLRHTLASIKSYSKVNMMGDAKASYFTIGKFCQLLSPNLWHTSWCQHSKTQPIRAKYLDDIHQ